MTKAKVLPPNLDACSQNEIHLPLHDHKLHVYPTQASSEIASVRHNISESFMYHRPIVGGSLLQTNVSAFLLRPKRNVAEIWVGLKSQEPKQLCRFWRISATLFNGSLRAATTVSLINPLRRRSLARISV